MIKLSLLLLALVLGCKSSKHNGDCDADFDRFFSKFAADSVFQKKHVEFPLHHFYSDEDFPLDLMEAEIDSAAFAFTDFTADKSLYEITVHKVKDSVIYTRTWRESYGAMTYKFVYKNNCWKLVAFHDITD